MDNTKYYVELVTGAVVPCDEWHYWRFMNLYNYIHKICQPGLTIIKKGN